MLHAVSDITHQDLWLFFNCGPTNIMQQWKSKSVVNHWEVILTYGSPPQWNRLNTYVYVRFVEHFSSMTKKKKKQKRSKRRKSVEKVSWSGFLWLLYQILFPCVGSNQPRNSFRKIIDKNKNNTKKFIVNSCILFV